MHLPKMRYNGGMRESSQLLFGGLNHNLGASEGDIYDMKNITSKYYPLLSPCDPRRILSAGENVKAVGDRWIIKGTDFIYDGEVKNKYLPLSDTPKEVVEMGNYILIFPDKFYYNADEDKGFGTYQYLEVKKGLTDGFYVEGDMVSGLYAYEGQKIYVAGCPGIINRVSLGERMSEDSYITVRIEDKAHHVFEKGEIIETSKGFGLLDPMDFLKIGTTWDISKNDDGSMIASDSILDENLEVWGVKKGDSVVIKAKNGEEYVGIIQYCYADYRSGDNDSTWYTDVSVNLGPINYKSSAMRVKRIYGVPDFDYVFSHNNRLWGVYDGKIYASALGDPKNFFKFEGLSTDSWSVDYLTKEFTGACVYNGNPTFWTKDSVITIRGDSPSTFATYETFCEGVLDGKSMAVVDGYLFYLSPLGVCVYTGSYPTLIHSDINEKFTEGVGFTDGTRYYISAKVGDEYKLYAYDTKKRMWHIEDDLKAVDYDLTDGALRVVTDDGRLVSFYADGSDDTESFVEFADLYHQTEEKKQTSKLSLRAELEAGARMTVKICYDSGEWMEVTTLTTAKKRSYYLPIIPRRCDHYRIKIEGKGQYKLYAISRETYRGSKN